MPCDNQDSRCIRTLCSLRRGDCCRVWDLLDGPESDRLRELGLGRGKHVRVICDGDPFVCQVGHCRLGLGRRLARYVMVDTAA